MGRSKDGRRYIEGYRRKRNGQKGTGSGNQLP